MRFSLPAALLVLTFTGSAHADLTADAEQHGDIDLSVTLDSAAQRGSARAAVRIHADPPTVWALLTNCASAVKLVPGLIECTVVETAPDHSWQLIRHVVDYSWYVPRLTFVFRAEYAYPEWVSIRRVSGDLQELEGSWVLQKDGDYTIAHYSVALAPGFWVPRWLMKVALRHDLPKMLRALRSLAESPA